MKSTSFLGKKYIHIVIRPHTQGDFERESR